MNEVFGSRLVIRPLAFAALAFLYFPILVIIVLSFNDSTSVGLPWKGFTTHWYVDVANNKELLRALMNSFLVASGTVVISVLLGVPAAVAMDRYNFIGKSLFRQMSLLPLVLPGIITGVSILSLYLALKVNFSLLTLTLALGTASMSIIITEVFARLQQIGRTQELAAYDMGANEWEVFRLITLPNMATALIGGVLICFSLALDELAVSFLLIGQENTLPMYVWSTLRREVTPEVNAIATITILISLTLVSSGIWLSHKRN